MATSKKSAAPKKTTLAGIQAFPAKSAPVKAVKPTKAPKPKKVDGVAAALDRFAADKPLTKSVAAKAKPAKRAVVDNGAPVHKARTAAQLVEILSQMPKGALVGPMINADDDLLAVYNMRGRCIAQIQKDMKPGTAYTK